MDDRIFTAEQFFAVPREEVFAFFATPENLETITPPWLGFRISSQSTPDVREGTEFTYRLRIHGIPVTWKSRIEQWLEHERFVDVQLRGPYARWHHTHEFYDRERGTVIRDRVRYRLPLGRAGDWIAGRWVASEVKRIFDYRARRTAELLRPA